MLPTGTERWRHYLFGSQRKIICFDSTSNVRAISVTLASDCSGADPTGRPQESPRDDIEMMRRSLSVLTNFTV